MYTPLRNFFDKKIACQLLLPCMVLFVQIATRGGKLPELYAYIFTTLPHSQLAESCV